MHLDAIDDVGLDAGKRLKVKLPKRLHLHLHHRRILEGVTISGTVQEALESFFPEPAEGSSAT